MSQLPGEGTRMNPSYAALLPKIVSPNATPAIATLAQASYYRIMGVEITEAAGQTLNYGLVTSVTARAQTSLAQVPHHLILDRVYIHGNSSLNLSRCVTFNSAWSAVIDSYLSECHAQGFDSQAIGGWNGPGPFKIVDNYLEAAGENILFGGADPSIVGMNPSDIEVRHNHIIKPPAWRGVWTAKNLFECKDARRVLLEGNVLENCWPDAQTGHAILLQALTDGNTAPWTTVQDVTIRYNWIKNAAGGATVDSRVAYNTGGTTPVMPTQPSQRISFQNNLFENIGNDPAGGAGYLFALFNDLQNVSLLHNTGAGTKALVEFDGNPQTGLVIQDNVVGKGDYGFFGSGEGEGNSAIAFYAPGAAIQRNVIFGNTSTGAGRTRASIRPNNSFPATAAAVGFANWGMARVRSLTDFGLEHREPLPERGDRRDQPRRRPRRRSKAACKASSNRNDEPRCSRPTYIRVTERTEINGSEMATSDAPLRRRAGAGRRCPGRRARVRRSGARRRRCPRATASTSANCSAMTRQSKRAAVAAASMATRSRAPSRGAAAPPPRRRRSRRPR